MKGMKYIIMRCERTIGLLGSWFSGMFFDIVRRMVRNWLTTITMMKMTKTRVGSDMSCESRMVCDSGTPKTWDASISLATDWVIGPSESMWREPTE